jgi:glutathione synthase/RimK-type ligase-like ATP-grasp enzyme
MISICGKAGSHAVREIVKDTNIVRYRSKCLALVNYGLAGKRFEAFWKKFPGSKGKPTINRNIGLSKYKALNIAKSNGILVPESYLSIPQNLSINNFITKRFNSQGGKGIDYAKRRTNVSGFYYQRFVRERKYELRVHAFSWIDKKDWLVQKRIGDVNSIAWNFSAGGKFYSISNKNTKVIKEAIDTTAEVLKIMDMGFGAADFILDSNNKLFFIEINSAPGFENLSKPFYVHVFNSLSMLSKNKIISYAT